MSKIANGVWFTIAVVALLWAAFSNVPTLAMFLIVDYIAHYTGYPVAWLIVLMIVYHALTSEGLNEGPLGRLRRSR